MNFIKIKVGSKTYFVQRSHIVYIESDKGCTIHLSNGVSFDLDMSEREVMSLLCEVNDNSCVHLPTLLAR